VRFAQFFSTYFRNAAALAGALLLAGTATALAQATIRPEASPAAPGDLSRPAFDTTTPLYNMADKLEQSANTVVAEVDGRAITLGDVGDLIRNLPPSLGTMPFESLYPGVVDQLVKQQALVIRAQHQALDEDPMVRRRVKEAADHALANELLHHEIMKSITEEALLARYKKEIAGKPGPTQVHLRVIMIPSESQAQDLIKELQGGADFATVAKRSSQDATAPVGGDLGFMRLDALNPEVGAVAFALPPGQISAYPIRSAGAWFIVKVEERRQQPTPSFAEVRDQLTQAMLREGVAGVVKQALAGVVVREYNFTGKGVDNEKASDAN
jgi:peptidyl-prolyl cis-trans isomerase C